MFGSWFQEWRTRRIGTYHGVNGIPQVQRNGNKTESPYENSLKALAEQYVSKLKEKWNKKDKRIKIKYCKNLLNINNITPMIEPGAKKEIIPIWYWFILVFLMLCEYPLNSIIFEIFGADRYPTLLMALGVCFSIPCLAHFLGKIIREVDVIWNFKQVMKVILLTLIAFAVLMALVYVRVLFFEIDQRRIKEVLKITLSPMQLSFAFFALNLLIFSVALVASCIAHPNITPKERDNNKLWTKTNKLETKNEGLKITRQKLHQNLENKFKQVENELKKLINIYRDANILARKSNNPIQFNSIPKLEFDIPKLDTDCS